jgi:lipid-A-disaccharide synthase
LFVTTGETSGDELAAAFVRALRRRLHPRPVVLDGVGGPALQALGLTSRFPQTDIQLMGVLAVLKRLFTVLGRIRDTADAVLDAKPDLLLTVDAQDFSMRVARKVRAGDPSIPIVHWVAPTVWAWRPGRAKAMAPHVDRLLALLPFEPGAFAALGGPRTVYVGHPLRDQQALLTPDGADALTRANSAAPVVLLLPGSRRSEIQHLMPVFRDAARMIHARYPQAHLVLPAAPHWVDAIEADLAGWAVKPEVVRGDAAKRAAFRRARVALAASGTVTLELALAGVPLVGAYRGHPLEAAVARRLVRSHSVLLCNLVLGRNVAPELLQEQATAQALAEATMALIPDGPARAAQLSAFAEIPERLALPEGRASADVAVGIALEAVAEKAQRARS